MAFRTAWDGMYYEGLNLEVDQDAIEKAALTGVLPIFATWTL